MQIDKPESFILFANSDKNIEPLAHIVNYTPEINHTKVDAHWNDFIAKNPKDFNGSLLGVKSIAVKNNQPILECFLTNYKTYRYSRDVNDRSLCNPLTVGNMFITADDKIILGPRKGNIKTWQLAGGMFDPEVDVINNAPDFKHCTERELSEELCDLDLYDYKFLGLSMKNSGCFSSVIYSSRAKQTFAEIEELHAKFPPKDADEMPILKGLSVDEAAIENLLNDNQNTPLSGTNKCVILLFAKDAFGDDFYYRHLNHLGIEEALIKNSDVKWTNNKTSYIRKP